jgi:hypothetical protein
MGFLFRLAVALHITIRLIKKPDETRISVSMMTVEFKSEGAGTRLTYTEQCVFLDGLDTLEDHRHGFKALLDNLDIEMAKAY